MQKEQLEVHNILNKLGFELEYDQSEIKGKEWIRYRHRQGDKKDSDFALIIYNDFDLEDNLRAAAEMLIKIGKDIKRNQLLSLE